jgi:sugar (pentulose or hexulose) kinase
MVADPYYIAIDVGAGLGVKIGLFAAPFTQIGTDLLRRDRFDGDYPQFVACLLQSIDQVVRECGKRMKDIRAIGIASPGLFRSDGTYLLPANLSS